MTNQTEVTAPAATIDAIINQHVLPAALEEASIAYGRADRKTQGKRAAMAHAYAAAGVPSVAFYAASNDKVEPDAEYDIVVGENGEVTTMSHDAVYSRIREMVIIAYNTPTAAALLLSDPKSLSKPEKKARKKLRKEAQAVGRNMANWRRVVEEAEKAAAEGEETGPGARRNKDLYRAVADRVIWIDKKAREADWTDESMSGQREFDATRVAALCGEILQVVGVPNPNLAEEDADES